MVKSCKEYVIAVLRWWWIMVIGIVVPITDYIFQLSEKVSVIPSWVWWAMGILGLTIAQFLAFHKMRIKQHPALAGLTKFLETGNDLFNTTVGDDTELEHWHEQFNRWFDDTKFFIQKSLSITDARLFADITSVKQTTYSPVYNDYHRDLLRNYDQYLSNLRSIINRYYSSK